MAPYTMGWVLLLNTQHIILSIDLKNFLSILIVDILCTTNTACAGYWYNIPVIGVGAPKEGASEVVFNLSCDLNLQATAETISMYLSYMLMISVEGED